MTTPSCGCAAQPCGCCNSVQALTPADETNRPGLPALRYRVGTHGQFLQTMQARLATTEVQTVGPDGQTPVVLRPLQGLTTRDPGDPAIALLDAWATVGDVLSFYQERIANEGYLRTATERRSVLELARQIGYALRPGVAASTFLAYTLDDNQAEPVTIPAGAAAQSVPDPGEQAQTFETSEDLLAHREWNNLQVRLHQPQNITLDSVLALPTLQVAGTSTGLRAGDKLLFTFGNDATQAPLGAVRVVASVDTRFADGSSAIALQPVDAVLRACMDLLRDFLLFIVGQIEADPSGANLRLLGTSEDILGKALLGTPGDPNLWAQRLHREGEGAEQPVFDAIEKLGSDIEELHPPAAPGYAVTDPSRFVGALLKPAVAQVRNSLNLPRSLGQAFLRAQAANVATPPPQAPPASPSPSPSPSPGLVPLKSKGALAGSPGAPGATKAAISQPPPVPTSPWAPGPAAAPAPVYADVGTQVLVSFAPQLARSYYVAWAGAQINPTPPALQAVFALRVRAAPFGATAARLPTYSTGHETDPDIKDLPAGTLLPQDKWRDWRYGTGTDETDDNVFLDQANDAVGRGGLVLLDREVTDTDSGLRVRQRQLFRIADAATSPRSAYGLSGPSTRLQFDDAGQQSWRDVADATDIADLRKTQLYLQNEPLTLVDEPLDASVADPRIPLDGLYSELTSGRWVILAGERADIAQVDGVPVAELQMISGLSHGYDVTLPGDQAHTTLLLATPLAYQYKRATLKIYGNVAKATHGATRNETLGSGNGAQALQSFTLKQPPLTFVAAPTAAGAASTLKVYVDDVQWKEADSLAGLAPKDRSFATLTDDAGATTLTFGNGVNGARLPTGVENVKAVYRNGIGAVGNVKAGQLTLLQTKPLGVKAVVNPLRASGGADAETRDLTRENAPLSVTALDRLVSLQDHADFVRRFAGIAKTTALRTTDGRRELIYLTIAGVGDAPIDVASDLYRNLLDALRQNGATDLPLRVDLRERPALVLSAKIKLLPGRLWDTVVAAARAQLLNDFGFDARALGQAALLSEVISSLQHVPGVAWVDVDAFGAVPERAPQLMQGADGSVQTTRVLLTQDQIAAAVAAIVNPPLQQTPRALDRQQPSVPAWPGGLDHGALRPAEIVVFTPAVPDTLILNQIL